MPAKIEITPRIRRIIEEGRDATPPKPWKTIADEIGVRSWRTPINMAIRLGIYKRVLGTGGRAEVAAAWERMARDGLIRPGQVMPPPLVPE